MRVYRELRFVVPRGQTVDSVIDGLAAASTSRGWKRDRASEQSLPEASLPVYCFVKSDRPATDQLTVWLTASSDRTELRVANILDRSGNLSQVAYNEWLVQFFNAVIEPTASTLGVQAQMTADELDIDQLTAPSTSVKLRAFAAAANKYTGSSHPSDAQRWTEFLVDAHVNPGRLTPDLLSRWLEDQGFPMPVAERLAEEFESGQGLLSAYDRKVG